MMGFVKKVLLLMSIFLVISPAVQSQAPNRQKPKHLPVTWDCSLASYLFDSVKDVNENPLEYYKWRLTETLYGLGTSSRFPVSEIAKGRSADIAAYYLSRINERQDYLELLYGVALSYSQMNQPEKAMIYVKQAVDAGLPLERFLAGPRKIFAPLIKSEVFQRYYKDHPIELLHGPMVGSVTDTSARFWVRTASEISFKVQLSESDKPQDKITSNVVKTSAQKDYTGIIEVVGLKPDTEYYYYVVLNDKPVSVEPRPSFKTYPPAGSKASFQVGFGGGADFNPIGERMWDTIFSQRLLAFLLLGDNVYIDYPNVPETQRYCYYRRYSRPEFRRMTASASIYAIYDDHDFGSNDCIGGAEIEKPPWKRQVWKVFTENWINPYYAGGKKQPGCWNHFSIGDVDFFMLDGRYYRTDPDKPDSTMLGPVQKNWLFDKLEESKATFKIIASPVPWAKGTKPGPGGADTWDGFSQEREQIFSFIEQNRIEGVFLLSADRHRSDAWKICRSDRYDLYEASSSNLVKVGPHKEMADAVFSYNDKCSFGLLKFDTTKDDPELIYQVVNIDNEIVHTLVLKKSQLSFGCKSQKRQ